MGVFNTRRCTLLCSLHRSSDYLDWNNISHKNNILQEKKLGGVDKMSKKNMFRIGLFIALIIQLVFMMVLWFRNSGGFDNIFG